MQRTAGICLNDFVCPSASKENIADFYLCNALTAFCYAFVGVLLCRLRNRSGLSYKLYEFCFAKNTKKEASLGFALV